MPIDAAFQFDREKYMKILKLEGTSAVVTALQHDMHEIEFECFEGSQGWQPDLYQEIKKYRDFSREVWDLRMTEQNSPSQKS